MRIAIDMTAVGTASTRLYMKEVLLALDELKVDHDFLVYAPDNLNGTKLELSSKVIVQTVKNTSRRLFRILWEQCILPILLKREGIDVLLAPFDIAPVFCPCPIVLAVRNPAPLAVGDYSFGHLFGFRLKVLRLLTYVSCKNAHKVFFPTKFASEHLGAGLKVPEDKRAVVHHGLNYDMWRKSEVNQSFLANHGLNEFPFILFASAFYRPKCADTLVRGFADWLQNGGDKEYRLVLVGAASEEEYYEELKQLAMDLGVGQKTLFLGQVDHEHMPSLYRSASVFVLPSSLETFGHPYVEAMASGVPIICADIPPARELCGDSAMYFPVNDVQTLTNCMTRLLSDTSNLRQDMIKCGYEQCQSFSWKREAKETLALLEEAAVMH